MNMTVSDYTGEDGWEDGTEICPHCERPVGSVESGYHGPVYNTNGDRYDHRNDTQPKKGPYFCEECWEELQINQRKEKNKPLGDFA